MAAMRSRSQAVVITVVVAISSLLLLLAAPLQSGFVGTAGPFGQDRALSVRSSLRGRADQRSFEEHSSALTADAWGTGAVAGLAAFVASVVVTLATSSPASAFFGTGNSGEIIGELEASGLVFKDTINVERITDPKVSGITLYQTDFSKSSFDKLKAGNLLQADPSASGLACSVDGKVLAKPDISKDKRGEEIFSEAKGIIGKTLKVKRVFDEKSNNVVYVVYTERLNKDDDPNGSRFKSQACAIHLDGFQ
eukprot:TRINITY_DN209_c0_g2_i1.p1 TRINITY_DN209_c0_g2~~TRINITY_DN209_c0_g2_i1.p1  ORF type:complete len:251 (-),score=51.06 TRINITY_DN209_c0_g2_i1:149-901(-)